MLEAARIPLPKVRKSILLWAAVCCLFYMGFMLLMRALNLLEVTGLRAVNYLVLFIVCFMGIKKWVTTSEHYVPFLTVFLTTFLTGIFSFVFFCLFLILYAQFDPSLTDLFNRHAPDTLRAIPSVIILFEGSAISIVIAFITMQYFRRYEEGEVSAKKHQQQH
jgi:hypothetical protein